MNRYLLLILLFCIQQSVAQYTAIPDPNFEQFLIDEGIDSEQVLDGQILTVDAENVTDMTIGDENNNISDLTGIEAFTLLLFLDVAFTNCTSMNFSSNTFLSQLSLVFNNELESLIIDGCTDLTLLNVLDSKLTTLNLSENIRLNAVGLANNELVSLDLSNNNNLAAFSCSDNNLTYLDVRNGNNTSITNFNATGNPDLLCILVDDKEYSETNWTMIDPNSSFVESEAECDALGLADFTVGSSVVYPIPAKSYFQVSTAFEFDLLSIYDLMGRRVKVFTTPLERFPVTDLSAGRYFILLENKNKSERVDLLIN